MQLSLDFEAGLTEKHKTLLDVCAHVAHMAQIPLKAIAAELDCSPSDLTRKLSANPGDKRNFSVLDLVNLIEATGDPTPIYWLIERFKLDDKQREQRALAEIAKHVPAMMAALKQLEVHTGGGRKKS